ncbi:MAG TPA: hypothetical protein VEH04_07960 [Verrucomicrobiae bacterium]|nr:hypothetical protein [Verrucomicrobiae bacterium]
MLKLLQELRGFSELSRPHSSPKPSALYLMQLRRSRAQRPKYRLVIQIDLQDVATLPTPVKITHITPNPTAEQATV